MDNEWTLRREVKIRDDGGRTKARYTLVISQFGVSHYYLISEHPFDSDGVCSYAGSSEDGLREDAIRLGDPVSMAELTNEVQMAVFQLYNEHLTKVRLEIQGKIRELQKIIAEKRGSARELEHYKDVIDGLYQELSRQ